MTSNIGLNGKTNRKHDPAAGGPAAPRPVPSALREQNDDAALRDGPSKSGDFRIKSYYARTVEEALARAREEMGIEAVLVHSRKTPLESRHLGPYEVVFSYPGKGSPQAHDANARPHGGVRESPAG